MTYYSRSSSSPSGAPAPPPPPPPPRGALAYFEHSDWSEDLESSLKSFMSLREEFNEDNDSNGDAAPEEEGRAEPTSDSLGGGGENDSNDDDALNDDDDDQGDDDDSLSASGGAVRVPEEFLCPLTLSVMRDPVVSKFGHSYERDAILGWLVEHRQTCPLTRKPLSLGGIITNHQLRGKIRKWQLDNELDITVLCNASDVMRGSESSTMLKSASNFAPDASLSRLGGFYIVPDLDDTERSTDDEEDEDATSARPASSSAARRAGSRRPGEDASSRPSTRRRSRNSSSTDASRRAARRAGSGNYRLVSGISRRIFGGRPPAA